jgi:magnesium transporter
MNQLQDYLSAHDINDIHSRDIAKILKALNNEEFSNAINLVPKNLVDELC